MSALIMLVFIILPTTSELKTAEEYIAEMKERGRWG